MTSDQWDRRSGRTSNFIRKVRRIAIYLRDGFACVYCQRTAESGVKLTLDHLKPRAKGGSHKSSNLVTSCTGCNFCRKNRPLSSWAHIRFAFDGVDGMLSRIRNARRRKVDLAAARRLLAIRNLT